VSLDALALDIDELGARPVIDGVTTIVGARFELWQQPTARAFTSVLLREGGPSGQLATEVAQARRRIEPLFARWIECGAIPSDHDPGERPRATTA
jgi:hypothetical protein